MFPFKHRIPFELAEPGTDPTSRPNPHPRKSWKDAVPWMIALAIFLLIGYRFFIRPEQRQKSASASSPRPRPTSIVTPVPTPQGFLSRHVTPYPTATATLTPTVISVSTQTPTPTPQVYTYGVFVDGEQIICWCAGGGDVGPTEICGQFIPVACNEQE